MDKVYKARVVYTYEQGYDELSAITKESFTKNNFIEEYPDLTFIGFMDGGVMVDG